MKSIIKTPLINILTGALLCTLNACGGGEINNFSSHTSSQRVGALAVKTSTATTASGYYVDALNGNDSNTGTISSPWKTLAKVGKAKLTAGQGIYLACGSTWREMLTLGPNQLVAGAKISGYGTTCATSKAVVSGADDFSKSWTKYGNIWSRKIPTTTPKINRLFINGSALRTAQWPNYGGLGNEYAIADALTVSGNSSIYVGSADATQLTGKDVVGATLQVRSEPWYIDQRTVATYAANVITLTAPTNYPMEAGDGYVLQDKLWMLDAPGEFYHDTANGVLYIYPPDTPSQTNLNNFLVEGAVRDTGIVISGVANISLSNLALKMMRSDGLSASNSLGLTIDSIEATSNARSGMKLSFTTQPATGITGASVTNSVISDNWLYGIDAGLANGVVIAGNTVTNTGTIGNAGWTHAAIMVGDGSNVSKNIVNNSAYHGVRYLGGGGTLIDSNLITNYCVRLADGGGIYTWNGPKISPRRVGMLSTVTNNRIGSAKANTNGAPGGGNGVVVGIYLDDFSRQVTVKNNTVFDAPFGIYFHNALGNVISNNNIWMTTRASIWAGMDQTDADYMTGNVVSSNTVVPFVAASGTYPQAPVVAPSNAFWYLNYFSGTSSLQSSGNFFSGNNVIQITDGSTPMAMVRSSTASAAMQLSASGWLALNPAENLPTSATRFAKNNFNLGPELVLGGDFSTGLSPWNSWFNVGSAGYAAPSTGVAGCSGACMDFVSGLTGDLVSSPSFSMRTGVPHMISLTAALHGTGEIDNPTISRDQTPWDSFVALPGLSTRISLSGNSGDIIKYEAYFTASSNAPARINLKSKTPGLLVSFDSISLREITGFTTAQLADVATIVHAPVSGAKVVSSCADLGWPAGCLPLDLAGKSVGFPFTIPMATSAIYLRGDSAFRR